MAIKKAPVLLVVLCAAAALGYGYWSQTAEDEGPLKIYGSVDMRTVSLAFEEAGRIERVLVEEGHTL